MEKYVCGFLGMNGPKGSVALIKKQRPPWQFGLLNGIGGHIEKGESPLKAMRREFYEETGLRYLEWTLFLILDGPGFFPKWRVYFFRKLLYGEKPKLSQLTSEKVSWFNTQKIQDLSTINNLKWIVPMALNPIYNVISAKEK